MSAYAGISLEILKNIGAGIPLLRHLKEKYSFRRSELLADYERPFAVFERMLERCGGNLNLEGKVVLEVGPGYSLAMGLLFLAHGARKVFLIDRFKHLFWDRQDIVYHEKVMERIKTRGLPFGDSAIRAVFFKNGTVHCEQEKLEYRLGDAAVCPWARVPLTLFSLARCLSMSMMSNGLWASLAGLLKAAELECTKWTLATIVSRRTPCACFNTPTGSGKP